MFEKLKRIFTIQLVLIVLDLDKKIRIETNVSEYITK